MRTRFIGTDFFRSAPVETLEFLRCPLPHLPPAQFSNFEQLQSCFDEVSVLGISLDIQRLPIEGSLSKFFSGVLPQIIDVEIGGFADDQSCAGPACFDLRSSDIQNVVEIDTSLIESETFSEEKVIDNLGSGTLQVQGKDERAFNVSGKTSSETVQFEIPEVNISSPTTNHNCHCQMENFQIFCEITDVANEVDMPTPEFRQQDFLEIQQSFYSVDSISVEYPIEQKADLMEDSGSTQGKLDSSHSTFFLFEIDEESLGLFKNMSTVDELIAFEHIDSQNWSEEDEVMNNAEELLGFTKFDLLVYLSDHCLATQCPEVEVPCSNFLADINFIGDTEDSEIEQMLSVCHGKSDDILASLRSVIFFEEFNFIDLELYSLCGLFSHIATEAEVEAHEEMFGEAMKFRSFSELIVSDELTLMDGSFKSLPVPILSDSYTWSLHSFVEEIVTNLELESASMFDGLYLDWHVLEEDNGNRDVYFFCWKMLEDIDTYSVNTALNISDDWMLVFNSVLCDGSPVEQKPIESKEMLDMLFVDLSKPSISCKETASGKLLSDEQRKIANGNVLSEIGSAKFYVSAKCSPQVSDLEFFLNPYEGTGGIKCKSSKQSPDTDKVFPVGSADSLAACGTTEEQLQSWNVKLHQIKLSAEIVGLVDNFRKSFLVVLENDKELMDVHCPSSLDDISLLRIPKEKLMHQIEKAPGTRLAHGDENQISLVALCAIKQMAWYLCYYGLRTTYLYIDQLCSSMQCLKYRLSFLQTLIEDMYWKAEKEIIEFHPSLSVIKELLQSNVGKSGKKLLIVAERLFWWPLKKLLTSMKMSCYEPQNFWTYTNQQNVCNDFSDAVNVIFQSDCCLVSHEHITASFPFDKFGILLEYGGSFELSRVSTISPELDDFPLLYFLKVELEDSGVAKALCDGVDMPMSISSTMEGDPNSISALDDTNNKVKELLNFIPVEENYNRGPVEAVDSDETSSTKRVQSVSLATESKKFQRKKSAFPDTVIIVNTQNFDKEMVISRRSTYQKIIAMEKVGVQVVERDLSVPVDVLVDAAVCLAWYDLKNIRKKASAPDEAFSCLPQCIENIAASILTSLSFAFGISILVFEGEKSFLEGVMESSDELYAAAASLGINLQIFCSYSSEMTDEIILSCIDTATNLTGGLYPKMAESESLAESFLTAFPSINPLSAHAILSSGGILVEFLEWSHERRIQAVQNFKIPEESVALLGLLNKYGEREDSKSGITDSSSSVSYASNMQKFQQKSYSCQRKRKCYDNLQRVDICANGSDFEPLKLFSDGRLNPSRAAAPNGFLMSENSEKIDECLKPALSFDDKLFRQSEELDANMMTNTSKVSRLCNFKIPEGPLMSENIKNMKIPWNDIYSDAEASSDMATRNNVKQQNKKKSRNQQENLVGEVIDIGDYATFRNDTSNADSVSFSPYEVKKDSKSGKCGAAKKLFFGSSSLSTFPTSAQINLESDSWFSIANGGNELRKERMHDVSSSLNQKSISPKHQKGFLHEDIAQKTASNFIDLPLQEKDNGRHGGTSFWNAIHSNQSLQESPWTIEFLNRIREKSRSRQQSLPSDLSAPCVGYSRNVSKATKRKSPSILEFYKYQGDGLEKRRTEQQRQKRSVQPRCSVQNKKPSDSILRTWTPDDKRAKWTLSFATSGNGAQSKLVWSDKSSHTMRRRIVRQV